MKANLGWILALATVLIFAAACGAGDMGVATAPVPMAAPAMEAPAAADASFDVMRSQTMAANEFDFAKEVAESEVWAAAEDDIYFAAGNEATSQQPPSVLDRMVIRNAHLSMNTTDFERTVLEMDRILSIYGGFTESANRWINRRHGRDFWFGEYTLRVPVDQFDTVNRELMELGEVTSFSTSSDDVTMYFHDLANRLSIRQEEERRILDMIETATELEDLIRLEARLANVRIILEGHNRRMSEIDQLASFATISVSLQEVPEDEYMVVPVDSFADRMGEAWGNSIAFSIALLEGVAMLMAMLILPVSILAIPALAAFLIIKRVSRRANNNL